MSTDADQLTSEEVKWPWPKLTEAQEQELPGLLEQYFTNPFEPGLLDKLRDLMSNFDADDRYTVLNHNSDVETRRAWLHMFSKEYKPLTDLSSLSRDEMLFLLRQYVPLDYDHSKGKRS